MQRIHDKPDTVVMPQIDSIRADTFHYSAGGIGCTLGFLWTLIEHSIDIQAKDRHLATDPTAPLPSPTHAGGLFAVRKDYFFHLGGYDTQVWWGMELSFGPFRI